MKKKFILLLVMATFSVSRAYSYALQGHEIVGAIVDEKLSGKPVEEKVRQMLGDVSLATAAGLPDAIKNWDKDGPDSSRALPVSSNKVLDAQLREFWRANPPTTNYNSVIPSHCWFHYTDVPVFDFGKYADGKTGRSVWDIVHMITYCVRVLKGQESEQNARKITKPVAIVLLAHYIGDIHQPLHVGAEYFNITNRQPVNPDKGTVGISDVGGNSLSFKYTAMVGKKRIHQLGNLHSFWDSQTVTLALDQIRAEIRQKTIGHSSTVTDKEVVHYFASQEPKNWKLNLSTNVNDWAQQWADEILPIASQAHERLQFVHVKPQMEGGELIARGEAIEKSMPDGKSYDKWASNVVRDELHKAGWRLAELLEQVLE
ncbi:MAG: hypothetical protein K1X66_03025 [Verrucomicrobiae bacterium]|nr:hypothetical protein [Verrucomicrobiae bacterium]